MKYLEVQKTRSSSPEKPKADIGKMRKSDNSTNTIIENIKTLLL
jgi:hypothetical protein